MQITVLEQSFELPKPAEQFKGLPHFEAITAVAIDGVTFQVRTVIHPSAAYNVPTEVFFRQQRREIMAEIEQKLFNDYNRRNPKA